MLGLVTEVHGQALHVLCWLEHEHEHRQGGQPEG
jgi:hypothetical protein